VSLRPFGAVLLRALGAHLLHLHQRVLQVLDPVTLMGADLPPGMEYDPGNTIAVSLSGDDIDELRGYWARLVDGGTVSVPLEKQMWGDEFGMCTDRFGVAWMVDIAQPQA